MKFKKVLFLLIMSINLLAQENPEFEEYLADLRNQFEIEHIDADSVKWSEVVLLDTREKSEYEISRLDKAIWIGYDDFDLSRVDSIGRDKQIIVYCSVGYRSSKIGLELTEAGYKDVKNLNGGLFKWANEGRPLYTDSVQTNKIHAYNKKWGRFIVNQSLQKVY